MGQPGPMPGPGWYPDAGQDASSGGRFRRWDGARWTDEVAFVPGALQPQPAPDLRDVIISFAASVVLVALCVGVSAWASDDITRNCRASHPGAVSECVSDQSLGVSVLGLLLVLPALAFFALGVVRLAQRLHRTPATPWNVDAPSNEGAASSDGAPSKDGAPADDDRRAQVHAGHGAPGPTGP